MLFAIKFSERGTSHLINKKTVIKLYIKIVILLLLVWPKSFFGQTYFNMLYPPEPGTWGGGDKGYRGFRFFLFYESLVC